MRPPAATQKWGNDRQGAVRCAHEGPFGARKRKSLRQAHLVAKFAEGSAPTRYSIMKTRERIHSGL